MPFGFLHDAFYLLAGALMLFAIRRRVYEGIATLDEVVERDKTVSLSASKPCLCLYDRVPTVAAEPFEGVDQ